MKCALANGLENDALYSQFRTFLEEEEAKKVGWPLHSPNPLAHDDAVAANLWAVSLEVTGPSLTCKEELVDAVGRRRSRPDSRGGAG